MAARKSLLDRAREVLRQYRPTEIPATGAMIAAAVAVILHDGDEGLEALFIHRAERAGDTWSGQIAFPGGRQDTGDADLRATAIRETREEVGVDLTSAERLGVLDDLYPRTPVLPPVVVRPFVFALTARPTIVVGPEVQRAFWLPLVRLSEPGVRREVTLTLRGAVRVLPAYVVDDEMIWGMTERIVTPFVDLISNSL